jgi:transposase
MNRINIPILTAKQRRELEQGYKKGKKRCFRTRCQVILLKSEGRTSIEVGSMMGVSEACVNSLVNKYKNGGISVLHTQPGQGRKTIITSEDKEAIFSAIKANQQQLQAAKKEWEKQSGKKVCYNTFATFVKKMNKKNKT